MSDSETSAEAQPFDDLVRRYFDEDLSAAQLLSLNGYLREDPDARKQFVATALTIQACMSLPQSAHDTTTVQQDLATLSMTGVPVDLTEPAAPEIDDAPFVGAPSVVREQEISPPSHPLKPELGLSAEPGWSASRQQAGAHRWPVKWAAAAAVLIAASMAWILLTQRTRTAPSLTLASVANITRTVRAQWGESAFKSVDGVAVPTHTQLALDRGYAELTFINGCTIVVEAPARFAIESASAISLLHGRIVAKVPPPAVGFTVHTSTVAITDLGTEFGVEVSADQLTHAEVFKGRVRVALTLGAGQATTTTAQLGESQAVDVAASGTTIDMSTPRPLAFVREEQLASLSANVPQQQAATLPANLGAASNEHWLTLSRQLRRDPTLIAYYPFDYQSESPDRLFNRAEATLGTGDGTIQNARWDQGRFPGKPALRFNGKDSVVNVEIPGSFTHITFAAWLQLDSLDAEYVAILDSNGWERPGQVHWQAGKWGGWVDYYPKILSPTARSLPPIDLIGRWVQLVTTIDATSGQGVLYCNGVAVQNEAHGENLPLSIGAAQIGSFNPLKYRSAGPRTLHGRIDELAIFNRILSQTEVKALYDAGAASISN